MDVVENQVLAIALELSHRVDRNAYVKRRTRYLADVFAEVCDVRSLDATAATRQEIAYNRVNEHYRIGHE